MEKEVTKMDIVNKSKKAKNYQDLSESINEKILNESIKDWVSSKKDLLAKKFGYEKKPTPEEIAAMEKAKIDEYMKQAERMLKKGHKVSSDIINKIFMANMIWNSVRGAGNSIKTALNRGGTILHNKQFGSAMDIANKMNAIKDKDYISHYVNNVLSPENLEILANNKNAFRVLDPKIKDIVTDTLNKRHDSSTIAGNINFMNNLKKSANDFGNKISTGAKDLWNQAVSYDPNLLKHLGYAGGAAALAGGVYLLGKNIYRKRKAKRSNKTLSENTSYIIESFNLPNLKKSKSDRLVFNKLLKNIKLSEASILAAYFSTPIGMRYGIDEGKKYFKIFLKDFKENKNRSKKVKRYLEANNTLQLPELPPLDTSGISDQMNTYNSITKGMSQAQLDAFNKVGEELGNAVRNSNSSRKERIGAALDPIKIPKIKVPGVSKDSNGIDVANMDYSKLAKVLGPAAAAAVIAYAIKKYKNRKKAKALK